MKGDNMKHTYKQGYEAHLGITGDRVCIVPDQVADNQQDYDGKTFPVIVPAGWRGTGTPDKKRMRARLVGDDYNLDGPGTGDMIVRPLQYIVK